MNELRLLFDKYGTDKGCFHGYDSLYEPIFKAKQDQEINLLEIGIHDGASIFAFRDYFPRAQIYAFDIDDKRSLSGSRITIERGDESDRKFLDDVFSGIEFDIIIDDGGHYLDHQFIALEHLFPRLKPNGLYILEDLHTSLWPEYGGSHEMHNSPLRLLENISNGNSIKAGLFPFIKDMQNIIKNINHCIVHRTNNDNSITSIIYKK
jgi:hypothetical protein